MGVKTTSHNYMRKLVKLFEAGKIKDFDIANVNVSHDEWCDVDSGGFCNCNPDIVIKPDIPFKNN